MRTRADELIDKYFIQKFKDKDKLYVGIEVEMPLIHLDRTPVETSFVWKILTLLKNKFSFVMVRAVKEGIPYEAGCPAGDIFSFDTTYNTIEFSMNKERDLGITERRFYEYAEAIQDLAKRNGYLLCGMGTNPYALYADAAPLNTPAMLAKSEFLKKYTSHHEGALFHAFCASTQTHVDASLEELPDVLNLLGRLHFADGLLFSNSMPLPVRVREQCPVLLTIPQGLTCFRDILWERSEAPNTSAFEGEYRSLGEVAEHLKKLKLFVVSDGRGGFRPIRPTSFADYFSDEKNPEKDIVCFRSLEPVAPSRYGTVEIRMTCTQPLNEIFVPAAFYTGIVQKQNIVSERLTQFFKENHISGSKAELRRRAVCGAYIADLKKIRKFLWELTAIAEEGLKERGYGEERMLKPLKSRSDILMSPAKREMRLLEKGASMDQIFKEFCSVEGRQEKGR